MERGSPSPQPAWSAAEQSSGIAGDKGQAWVSTLHLSVQHHRFLATSSALQRDSLPESDSVPNTGRGQLQPRHAQGFLQQLLYMLYNQSLPNITQIQKDIRERKIMLLLM